MGVYNYTGRPPNKVERPLMSCRIPTTSEAIRITKVFTVVLSAAMSTSGKNTARIDTTAATYDGAMFMLFFRLK